MTWGHTRDGALHSNHEEAQMVVEELLADNEELPAGVVKGNEPAVAVNIE